MNFVIENYKIEYNKDDITYTNIKTGCSNTITKGQYELSLLRSSPCQVYFNGIPVWLMQRIQMKVIEEQANGNAEPECQTEGTSMISLNNGIYKKIYWVKQRKF